MTRLPNFFLVGTSKSGTSTLHLWLSQHPDIYLSPRKELHFFCSCPPHLRAAGSWEEYLSLFQNAQTTIVGEASPCYLYYRDLPQDLLQRCPAAKILISLRDPVERFWSHYLMNRTYRDRYPDPQMLLDQWETGPPAIAPDDLVGVGMYGAQLERFQRAFAPSQLKVVFLEEMAANPDALVADVLSFLQVESRKLNTGQQDKVYVKGKNQLARLFLETAAIRRLGVALLSPRVRRYLKYRVLGTSDSKPDVPEDLELTLRKIYRKDSLRLEGLLGRSLPWQWHQGHPI